jgi:hypothetical protein
MAIEQNQIDLSEWDDGKEIDFDSAMDVTIKTGLAVTAGALFFLTMSNEINFFMGTLLSVFIASFLLNTMGVSIPEAIKEIT